MDLQKLKDELTNDPASLEFPLPVDAAEIKVPEELEIQDQLNYYIATDKRIIAVKGEDEKAMILRTQEKKPIQERTKETPKQEDVVRQEAWDDERHATPETIGFLIGEDEVAAKERVRTELFEKVHQAEWSKYDVACTDLLNTVVREDPLFDFEDPNVQTSAILACIDFEEMRSLEDDGKKYLSLNFAPIVTQNMRESLFQIFPEKSKTGAAMRAILIKRKPRAYVLFGREVTTSEVANARRL